MKSKWLLGSGLFFSLIFLCAYAVPKTAVGFDQNNDGRLDKWVEYEDDKVVCVYLDQDFSGSPEYIRRFNETGHLIAEEIDFNRDGKMDDYYYYSNSVLQRRELDTNYDGKIDVWLYLREGLFVSRYERDTDYDGQADISKIFDDTLVASN